MKNFFWAKKNPAPKICQPSSVHKLRNRNSYLGYQTLDKRPSVAQTQQKVICESYTWFSLASFERLANVLRISDDPRNDCLLFYCVSIMHQSIKRTAGGGQGGVGIRWEKHVRND